ncbi:hypothetical protein IFM89_008725 [Coptis chinensis]|uniref:ABC transmembrane type-1 domain-containing protein n=1 Tax=Coptis chinensis TaxID=261450 RepID=A0A835LAM7_9MAGN|nr:hypothetical protein IFM89_008725 [Coptis chinensis]
METQADQAKTGCILSSQRRSSSCVSVGESPSHQSFSDLLNLHSIVKTEEAEQIELNTTEASENTYEVPLHRLFHMNKPELQMLILGCVSAVINGSLLPIFGVFISRMIQTFYEPAAELQKDSKVLMWTFVSLRFVSLMASTGRSYFFAIAGSQLIRRIRSMTFEKVVHMEIGWFDRAQNTSSVIGARLSVDAATIRGLVGDALALIVQNSASVLPSVAIALEANWQLARIVVALLPLLGFNSWDY